MSLRQTVKLSLCTISERGEIRKSSKIPLALLYKATIISKNFRGAQRAIPAFAFLDWMFSEVFAMTKDLTKGSPMGLILSFGVPVLLGNLFQQFYNVVDTAIVGKTLGGDALAAVGATGSVNFLVVGFCIGVCGGFTIPVAQQFGAGNEGELRRYMAGGAWLCLLFGALLTALTAAFCGRILTGMRTPPEIYQRAFLYILTIFLGLPAYFLYNFTAGVLRALGDSRTPVIWLSGAALLNIVLDTVFILTFHLDVFGAALATVLSQLVAGLGCLGRVLRGYPMLRTERADWRWDRRRMGELCLMGLPMGLQFSITAIGSVMIQTAVNGLGTAYVTAVTAASKVSMFFSCPFDAMGSTMATYGGQKRRGRPVGAAPPGPESLRSPGGGLLSSLPGGPAHLGRPAKYAVFGRGQRRPAAPGPEVSSDSRMVLFPPGPGEHFSPADSGDGLLPPGNSGGSAGAGGPGGGFFAGALPGVRGRLLCLSGGLVDGGSLSPAGLFVLLPPPHPSPETAGRQSPALALHRRLRTCRTAKASRVLLLQSAGISEGKAPPPAGLSVSCRMSTVLVFRGAVPRRGCRLFPVSGGIRPEPGAIPCVCNKDVMCKLWFLGQRVLPGREKYLTIGLGSCKAPILRMKRGARI